MSRNQGFCGSWRSKVIAPSRRNEKPGIGWMEETVERREKNEEKLRDCWKVDEKEELWRGLLTGWPQGQYLQLTHPMHGPEKYIWRLNRMKVNLLTIQIKSKSYYMVLDECYPLFETSINIRWIGYHNHIIKHPVDTKFPMLTINQISGLKDMPS